MADQTTPAYNRLLEDAQQIAIERNEDVDAVHVALAMITDSESVLAFTLHHKMGVGLSEAATRLRWFLDRPKPGPGEHYVADLDGTLEIRRDDTLEVVQRWTPDVADSTGD